MKNFLSPVVYFFCFLVISNNGFSAIQQPVVFHITGFGPFADIKDNPSGALVPLIVSKLHEANIPNATSINEGEIEVSMHAVNETLSVATRFKACQIARADASKLQ